MRQVLYALCIAILAILGVSDRAEARKVPDKSAGYVTDEAAILSASQRAMLEDKLKSLQAQSTAQVFILTVKSLDGDPLFGFSQRAFEKWKPGVRKKDNGILIVYSLAENGRRIHVGRGLEGDIPDAEAIRIIKELMDPHLAKKDYFQAFMAATSRVESIILGIEKTEESVEARRVENREIAKFLLFVVAFVALAFAHFYHPVLGGIVGGLSFAGAAWLIALGSTAIIVAAIIGAILGLILRWLTDIPWCGGGCGGMAEAVAGAGGDALGAGAELLGGLG